MTRTKDETGMDQVRFSLRDLAVIAAVLLTGAGLVAASMWRFSDRMAALEQRAAAAEASLRSIQTDIDRLWSRGEGGR